MTREEIEASIGEIKFRPPKGNPEDSMLARATGKTESGKIVASGTNEPDALAA